jgi:hypothetical protein
MAILCEPEFFVRWALGLSRSAKNSGWKIALNFAQLFFKKKLKKSFTRKPTQMISKHLPLFVQAKK